VQDPGKTGSLVTGVVSWSWSGYGDERSAMGAGGERVGAGVRTGIEIEVVAAAVAAVSRVAEACCEGIGPGYLSRERREGIGAYWFCCYPGRARTWS
jgi:hypothetical protein